MQKTPRRIELIRKRTFHARQGRTSFSNEFSSGWNARARHKTLKGGHPASVASDLRAGGHVIEKWKTWKKFLFTAKNQPKVNDVWFQLPQQQSELVTFALKHSRE